MLIHKLSLPQIVLSNGFTCSTLIIPQKLFMQGLFWDLWQKLGAVKSGWLRYKNLEIEILERRTNVGAIIGDEGEAGGDFVLPYFDSAGEGRVAR